MNNANDRIIKLANDLLEAITVQGHCVRSQGDYGSVNISIFRIGKVDCELTVGNVTNERKDWEVRGKLTAPLIPEKFRKERM